MRICENGVYRDMTPEEIEAMSIEESMAAAGSAAAEVTNPMTDMIRAMAEATTLAQMRAAAQAFLDSTGE